MQPEQLQMCDVYVLINSGSSDKVVTCAKRMLHVACTAANIVYYRVPLYCVRTLYQVNGATMCPNSNTAIACLGLFWPRSCFINGYAYTSPLDTLVLCGQVPLVREIMAGNKRGKRLLSLGD